MSPYSSTLAQARLDALEALVQALKDAETPDEKRRCAVAIFNAPDPCELDDTIEWNDEEDTAKEADTEQLESHSEASEPELAPAPDAADATQALPPPRATASPAALSGQAVLSCNTTCTTPPESSHFTHPAREAGECRLPAAQPPESASNSSIPQDSPLAHEMGERTSPPPTSHPNSFPDYPELAYLTDDQILHATSADLMQLMISARLPETHSDGTRGLLAIATAAGP